MKLQAISVRHYKSLSDVTVELDENVTVIVGLNSVGKSNFVDAMRFLRDAARDGLDHAVTSRGGITRVRQQVNGTKPFNLGFELAFSEVQEIEVRDLPPHSITYSLELTSLKDGDFKIVRENGICYNRRLNSNKTSSKNISELVIRFRDEFSRQKDGHIANGKKEVLTEVEPTRLALGANSTSKGVYYSFGQPIENHIDDWRFTTLYPSTLRELKSPDTETSLREDGGNWASMIRAAKRTLKGRQTLERINEMMRLVLPNFQDVQVSTIGSYLVPKFRFEDTATGKAREFDPVQLSDGTLRIYGILLSLYLQPSPTLLVIEEPEQTVHPGVLAMLSEAFKEVASTVQIIITTHSPQLVDHFAPEQVRVANMNNGVTEIAPLKNSQMQAVQRGLMGMGEFMAAEGLLPEAKS